MSHQKKTKLQTILLYPAILNLNELSSEVYCSQGMDEHIAKEGATVVEVGHEVFIISIPVRDISN